MSKLFGLLWLFSVLTAVAHPGIGMVQDRQGNVFFTDTKQVWKITPDGRVAVALAGVHTHELCLDAEDNLYGEHLWYEGDGTGKWRHRVWGRKPDGTVGDVIPAREGFLTGYSFVRDRAGNMYWAERGTETVIKMRSPDGKIATHAAAGFRAVAWMTATADGTLYLMDAGDLRQVSPAGEVTTMATRLSGQKPPPAKAGERNYHMGLWTDGERRVYVAVAAERLVLRVDARGERKVVARSAAPWAPAGGMCDRDGNLWLLEFDAANAVRVRRLDRDGEERVFTISDPP